MRVLLDECVPRRLRDRLPGHAVRSVVDAGWARRGDPALLAAAEGRFDVLITVDSDFEFRSIPKRVAVVLVRARSSRVEDMLPFADPSARRSRPRGAAS